VVVLSVFTALSAASTVSAAPLSETKLRALDAIPSNQFGESVSIDADTVVVGAPGAFAGGVRSGAAYVFERNRTRPGNWGQVKKLSASDAAEGDQFGWAVAISGDTIAVGAWGDEELGLELGAVYVFERNHGGPDNWGEAKKLTASDAVEEQYFGAAVAASGDTIAVGAYGDQALGIFTGAAYVFERNLGGDENWGQVKKLAASDQTAFDRFGSSIGISGDAIVVGRYGDDELGHKSGSAYLFQRDQGGGDNWGEAKKLTASDADEFDEFGWSVAIDADRAVAGAHLDEDAAYAAGSEYHFARDQGGTGNWGEIEKLTASDATEWDEFGWAVALSGDTLVVAASADSVYVYAPPVDGDPPPQVSLPTMPIWGLWLLGATLLLIGRSRL
jgi:hypothetical protein